MKGKKISAIGGLVILVMLITTSAVIASTEGNGQGSTIAGGVNNTADGDFSAVGGGENNTADGVHSTIGGGTLNEANSPNTTVGGGSDNKAFGRRSTIAGGHGNTAGMENADSNFKGYGATVGGGSHNMAEAYHATIPGGIGNKATGDLSFAAGFFAQATHRGSFVWSDNSREPQGATAPSEDGPLFGSTGPHQFLIRAEGGVGINTINPTEMLVVGDPFSSSFPGNRITIGNWSGRSGINLGENNDQRAFILWQDQADYLELGTRSGGSTHGNTLVLKDDRVGVNVTDPQESLDVDGNVLANDFLERSSQRWKTNIQPLEGALEKIQSLRGVSYDWKANGEHDIGLIAEEVGEVIPEVVVYEENGQDAVALNYSRLVPLLIEAMKKQQLLLEDKDAQITALDARVEALEEALALN